MVSAMAGSSSTTRIVGLSIRSSPAPRSRTARQEKQREQSHGDDGHHDGMLGVPMPDSRKVPFRSGTTRVIPR